MGGPGAILGGRKKTQTETVTNDKRKTVLAFRGDGKQKTMFFGPELFDFRVLHRKKRRSDQPAARTDRTGYSGADKEARGAA